MTNPNDPVGPPARDRYSEAVADALGFWDRSANNLARVLDGAYSSTDAANDARALSAKSLEWAQDLFECWSAFVQQVAPPDPAEQPSSNVPCDIDESITLRPLTLQTAGFRAIGYGTDYFIADNDISFMPSEQIAPDAEPGFILKVAWDNLPPAARSKTIIFEGEVFASQTGTLVAAPVRFIKPAFAD